MIFFFINRQDTYTMSTDSVGYIPPASQFDTYLFKFQVIIYSK